MSKDTQKQASPPIREQQIVIKPEQGWAIYNPEFGFYYGWYYTRQEAIQDHTKDWKLCKKRGDRAIKIEIRAL